MTAREDTQDFKQQLDDLRAEADALYATLKKLGDADWDKPTQFKGWTPNDVMAHLYFTDVQGVASLESKEKFREMVGPLVAAMKKNDFIGETRRWTGDLTGPSLRERWHHHFHTMCDTLEATPPHTRIAWYGPDMGLRMFASSRQMETWAHGQEIYDLLGIERENTDRIKHVCVMGVKTFGWTYINRGEAVPEPPPHIRLTAPSGALWEWNSPQEGNRVEGPAVGFCQVVTQTRNAEEVGIRTTGDIAAHWMSVAQCFAGPPTAPPAAGELGPD